MLSEKAVILHFDCYCMSIEGICYTLQIENILQCNMYTKEYCLFICINMNIQTYLKIFKALKNIDSVNLFHLYIFPLSNFFYRKCYYIHIQTLETGCFHFAAERSNFIKLQKGAYIWIVYIALHTPTQSSPDKQGDGLTWF